MALGPLAPGLARQLGVLGEIYIDLLKMVVLPFMVSAVLFSVRKLLADKDSARMLPRTLVAFGIAFLLAALMGLLVSMAVAPGSHLAPENLLAMGRMIGTDAPGRHHDAVALFGHEGAVPAQGPGALILALIPVNIFAALAHGETLKVLVFSMLFGFAAARSQDPGAETLTGILTTVYQACLRMTHWFNRVLPAVLFAIVASQVAKTGLEPLRIMLKFLFALALGSLVLVLLSLWAVRMVSHRPWVDVLRSQRGPMFMAIATRSSYACMPAMITSLVDALGFQRTRIELLVPLGISLLRTGQALYYVVATLFLAQLYEVHLGAWQLVVVVAGAILTGFASSGMSGVIIISLTGLLCGYLRLPFEAALALFIAVDPVCDMLRTLVQVAGNCAFAAMAAGLPASGEV
jgi:Na+/H+-dicarboxylate symporter